MLYIYIELRYHRQLSRICPDVLDTFLSSAASSARKNGGAIHTVSGGTIYCFDHTAVGYAFSTSRVIADLRDLLANNRTRLKEYFILVGNTENNAAADSIREYIDAYDSVVTPDDGILLTAAAQERLAPYLSTIPLKVTVQDSGLNESPLFLYSGSSVIDYAPPAIPDVTLSIYTGFVRDPVSTFRNMLLVSGVTACVERLSSEEQSLFAETAHALDMYTEDRFSSDQTEYRVSACLDYYVLLFSSIQKIRNSSVSVTVYGSKPLSSAFDIFLEKLEPVCKFIRLPDQVYLPADLKNMPAELLDLSWLVYRSVLYLNTDEFLPFFSFLGKEAGFVEALGTWMYSYGLLSDPRDFRSILPALVSRIDARLGSRKGDLDKHVARFLWKKYEEGNLVPSYAFSEVLESLNFDLPDSFLVSCLFHGNEQPEKKSSFKNRFRDPDIAAAVEKTTRAWKAYDSGDLAEAGTLSRDTLQVFQNAGILSGEYRVLSLIALLSLARNHGDDSVVYLEYALENAERMHDHQATLCTLFDMALVHFILGNFHFSVCKLESVDRIVECCYAKNWEVLVLFMKGRIALELGDYRNAELYFQTAASLASFHQIPESVSLCRVWYARSIILQGRFATGIEILATCAPSIPDAYVFLLEAALVSGRKDDSISFLPSIAPLFSSADRWSSGKFTWKSGFAMAEDRCHGDRVDLRVVTRLYDVLHLCYRLRFDASPDQVDIITRISAHAKTACDLKDPYAGIYYFFAYDFTKQLDPVPTADATALLSRAFKYMQKRANEIDDNNMREQYMQTPIWNSRLYHAARDNMLI